MKFNTLFVAAICAGSLLSSCVHETAKERQLKYTHVTSVDGDAYAVIQRVGEIALTGASNAEQAEANGDARSKEVASKVRSFYTQLIPALDSLATAFHVDFPIKGIPAKEVAAKQDSSMDSLAMEEQDQDHGQQVDFVHQAQHEVAYVKDQLTRMTRNTNKDLRAFAHRQLSAASELYKQIGGQEDAHTHHH